MGDRFTADAATGTGSMEIPVPSPPGRNGFRPELSLRYDSARGNGPFGFGWSIELPAVTRKTDKGLPRYRDDEESDVFLLSGADDLVPLLEPDDDATPEAWSHVVIEQPVHAPAHRIDVYRPRIERSFDRIERWTEVADPADVHWRTISRDNVTSIFGDTDETRVASPTVAGRIFTWLVSAQFDDRGNAISYEYKEEDSTGVDASRIDERHRTPESRAIARYPKRIRYGNRAPLRPGDDFAAASWLFEVVLDYGEHDAEAPTPTDGGDWLCRNDPHSSYRSGWEIRWYRLCQRVLSFHHFADEAGVGDDCLVRSLEFRYRDLRGADGNDDVRLGDPLGAFLESATERGYRRQEAGGYESRKMPAVELFYSLPTITEDVHALDRESVDALPAGVTPTGIQWADVDGDGIPGLLIHQAGTWLYAPNLGAGALAPPTALSSVPADALSGVPPQFVDLEGDGQLDAVVQGGLSGFYERDEGGWRDFTSFESNPNLDWAEPNLRYVDLDGDGRADVLVMGDESHVWFPSLGERGYAEGRRVPVPANDDDGPRLVFGDGEQSVHLADMSGDGLSDLVRLRNGEVCYWPNLGHGRFGPKVTMGSPRFDTNDAFDQRRIRLIDVDGSGVTDIVYLGADGVDLYLNEVGNSFGRPHRLTRLPRIDDQTSVATVDLLGTGTACLVWSSGLEGDAPSSIRYVDLMGGRKPHLLVATRNNLGVETYVSYVPSTSFSLADRAAGRPWATRLGFPVHVVERVEVHDLVSHNRFATRYAYHHGYFDPTDREFRGFGMTEQWDTADFAILGPSDDLAANLDELLDRPPVRTVTWFHTGAPDSSLEDRLARDFAAGAGDRLPTSGVASGVRRADGSIVAHAPRPEDLREARRALKGSMLREEVYAVDDTAHEARPFSVSERNYVVELLQPEAGNRHAVCMTQARESVTTFLERGDDPRVTHDAVLRRDGFGNVVRSATVFYRRSGDPSPTTSDGVALPAEALDRVDPGQRRLWATLTENSYTNAIGNGPAWRAPATASSSLWELVNLDAGGALAPGARLTFEQLDAKVAVATDGEHDLAAGDLDAAPAGVEPGRRLLEATRRLYVADDLAGPLPLGEQQARALIHAEYDLAFTAAVLADGLVLTNNGASATVLTDPAPVLEEAGYVSGAALEADNLFPAPLDGEWWAPSGRVRYSPNAADDTAAELAYATAHFFAPARLHDPHGNVSSIELDDHALLPVDAVDGVGNHLGAVNDYRVMRPAEVVDANGNRTLVAFDALANVAGFALAGKAASPEGDSFASFERDLSDADVAALAAQPLDNAAAALGSATTRYVYDVLAFERTQDTVAPQPVLVCTITREQHADAASAVLPSFSYTDGFGREVQRKERAEAGPVVDGGPEMSPRWVGTGWTVLDNKGRPVRRFEPFFTATHGFEFDRRVGPSEVIFSDALGRVVAKLHPDGSYEKTIFDAWHRETWDRNDTVLLDPETDPDVAAFTARFVASLRASPGGWSTWHDRRVGGGAGALGAAAALRTEVHASTPQLSYLDSRGLPFLNVDRCRTERDGNVTEEWMVGVRVLDGAERERATLDARGRVAITQVHDLRAARVRLATADAGERVTLTDVAGLPVRSWDALGHVVRTTYDAARRPLEMFVAIDGGPERLRDRRVYGEAAANAAAANLRTRLHQHFDGAGVVVTDRCDFKGNTIAVTRRFTAAYQGAADWSALAGLDDAGVIAAFPTGSLAAGSFTTTTTYDAMNRPVEITTPDGSRIRPIRNQANLVERIEANVRGAAAATVFVDSSEYDAKGNRVVLGLGNGVRCEQRFDAETSRVVGIHSMAGARVLQDRTHVYDPVGNITALRDEHEPTVFFSNAVVEPHADYAYDSLYRLVAASGREHPGQAESAATTWDDAGRAGRPHPEDGQAMRRYSESYQYDAAGNLTALSHAAGPTGTWTRTFTYADASNNHLSTTHVGAGPAEPYTYDDNGNVTVMPHVTLTWEVGDRLSVADRGGGGRIYYHYDGSGQRIRTVFERQNGTRSSERLYLGGVEVFRTFDGAGTTVELERETLHVSDEGRRVACVETRTAGNDASPAQLTRYQLDDHLTSSCLELDDAARVITHEEYYPWGATSLLATSGQTQVPKRYRYTGKERDEGTGFTYHGARYYAPWLCRWTSCDPDVATAGPNLYVYSRNNPVVFVDPDGREARLIVDAATRTVTVQTTVHLYGANAQQKRQLQQVAAAAQNLWNNPIVATQATVDATPAGQPIPNSGLSAQVNNQQWTLRFDVQYQVHNAQNAPVRVPVNAAQAQVVYEIDSARAAQDGVRTGDNLLTFRQTTGPVSAGGVVQNVTVGTSVTNMVGEVTGNINTQAGRDALARRLAHETGHAIGLDERYGPASFFAQNGYPGFLNDIMGIDTPGPRVLEPSHVRDFLEVGAALAPAPQPNAAAAGAQTFLLSGHVDDTQGGNLHPSAQNWAQVQTAARTAAVARIRANTAAWQRVQANPTNTPADLVPAIPGGAVNAANIPANNPPPAQRRRRP